MRVNEETVLVGEKVLLVPYREQHVQRYHDWMADEKIRAQTASEPLSLEQEYDMQRSWHTDDDKLTFIVLARGEGDELQRLLETSEMAGDVNLFVSQRHEDDDTSNAPPTYDAELEVMIAEAAYRRKGLALEAIRLLMHYVSTRPTPSPSSKPTMSRYLPLSTTSFVAKIGVDNAASNALFAQLGFREVKRSEVFREIELRPDAKTTLPMQAPLAVLRWPLGA